MKSTSSGLRVVTAVLIAASFAPMVFAQASPLVITKSFNPASVALSGNTDSVATFTVTNPNATPLTNVQFSDAMPAGIDLLISPTFGSCSTVATGGGMFSINPGTDTFSSTSSVLNGGQSCTIIVRVRGNAAGAHVNTTSQVTATGAPPGTAASATLRVAGDVPTLSEWMLISLAGALALAGAVKLRA
jgi:hypothetical protein